MLVWVSYSRLSFSCVLTAGGDTCTYSSLPCPVTVKQKFTCVCVCTCFLSMGLGSQLVNMQPNRHEEMSGDLSSKTDGADTCSIGISRSALSPEPTTEDIVKMVTKWKK